MAKKLIVQTEKDPLKEVLVEKIASKTGFTKRWIYKVIANQPEHPITEEYMTARETLVTAVEKLVPFN